MFKHAFTRHAIALRRNRNHGASDRTQLSSNELISRSDTLIRGHTEDDAIDFSQGLANHVIETLTQQSARTVISGRIDQYQLVVFAVDDPADIVACRFGAARGDGDLVANKSVGQRRLSDIGTTNNGDEARAKVLWEVGNDDICTRICFCAELTQGLDGILNVVGALIIGLVKLSIDVFIVLRVLIRKFKSIEIHAFEGVRTGHQFIIAGEMHLSHSW
ncbi:hypothetical protein HMPREF9061_01030 [Actinomyces sp. oral taxon 181 str. F0379]|nr:hypothetical protein HMPREF9061_01030 [Actinomyces sp. oral taxon 181 str. F0379]